MSEFAKQLNQLIEMCHTAATASHNQIYSLEATFEAEDEMVVRHLDDVIARATDRRRQMFDKLTVVANMMGVVPVRAVAQDFDPVKQVPFPIPQGVAPQRQAAPLPSEQNAMEMFDILNQRKVAGGR